MNSKLAVFLAVALGASQAAAAEPWHATYASAYRAGKAAGRPVLVVLDDPAQAGARIDQVSHRTALPSAAEAALLANYELCHVDVATEYGKAVARSFGAYQFPYVAITDRKVQVLLTEHSGRFADDEWLATLAKYRRGEQEAPPVICTT
jgi:hypothetical protein